MTPGLRHLNTRLGVDVARNQRHEYVPYICIYIFDLNPKPKPSAKLKAVLKAAKLKAVLKEPGLRFRAS